MKVFEPVEEKVKIAQKRVKYSACEKLLDAFITLFSGAQGLVEVNKRLKADTGLQRAFGRTGCAEQWVVQDTLDACTAENVSKMHQAIEAIFPRHSQTYRHDYQLNWQVLDTDMTGRPCGRKAKFASKGYFAKQCNRRGRQEGYVIGTWYEEIVGSPIIHGVQLEAPQGGAFLLRFQQSGRKRPARGSIAIHYFTYPPFSTNTLTAKASS